MSQNACWRRIKRLEESGVISRRVTILDASALGLDLTVFVSLRASEHSEAWLDTLNSAIRDIPEVVEFYRMTGDVDYLLKLRVENMAAYEDRKRVVWGKSVSVSVDQGGGRIIKKKKKKQ